jgi:hypothetical protein
VDTIRYIEHLPIEIQLAHVPMAYPWNSCRYRLLGVPSRIIDATLTSTFNRQFARLCFKISDCQERYYDHDPFFLS